MKNLGVTKHIAPLGVAFACLLWGAPPALAQTTPPSGGPPAAPSPAPAGITNGTLPIESTILAYKVLFADADKIDKAISGRTTGKIVVVGTSSDIAAIVQLRIILSQERILERRLQTLTTALMGILIPVYAHPVIKGSVKLGAGFLASPADVATLIQTLGSITAVNQTLSSAAGALNDATLISLVAHGITSDAVYVPSMYPLNLLAHADLGDTYIGDALLRLESARRDAITASNLYVQALQDAQVVGTTVKGGPIFTNAEIDGAGAFAENAITITALANAVTLAASAVDGFETSLFTGQGYSPPSPAPAPPTPTPSPAPVALPVAVPAPPLPAPNPPASPAPTPGPQPATTAGTTLQQIFPADLLLRRINSQGGSLDKLQLLAVHALESGGGQLTKSNLFLGSRIYFGGGAVASFALYDGDGTLKCSGVGYGYKGNIREKSVQAELESSTPAVVNISTNCN
jgi:hypothetical protein